MKSKELKTMREKDTKELVKKVAELRKKVISLKPRITAGAEKNTSAVRAMKRDIAQILGIIQSQEEKK